MPDFLEHRYAPLEYREDTPENDDFLGVTIGGPVLNYGDIAQLPWGKERFEPGAFGDVSKLALRANRMHMREMPIGVTGQNLAYTDTQQRLSAEIKLLATTAGRDTAVDVRQKVLAGQSVEFRTHVDRVEDGTRIISGARLYGHGVVDVPAYPQSTVGQRAEMRSWDDYFQAMEYRNGLFAPPKEEPAPAEFRLDGHPNVITDDLGRRIFLTHMPEALGHDFEERQTMPRLRGRLPYRVDGITSMSRNEHVVFLPGAFGDSLEGEVLALVGNNYDDPLAGVAQRSLTFRDTDEALEFTTRRIPDTTVNRDFVAKLRGGFVRGVTAGWALQGSQTRTEDIEGGGKRIIVEKAMLCELRFRTRSAFPGESIQASRRDEARFLVV